MRLAVCRLIGRSGHEMGRELLRFLYREETGLEMPEILRDVRGKPYFRDSELQFSISHTKQHAVCVLSRFPVGVDAEELDRPIRMRIAHRVLSAGEMEQFQHAADPRRAFLTFWVLKEAAAKRSGMGLTGIPNDTDFSLSDPRVREWDGCLLALLGSEEGEVFYAL